MTPLHAALFFGAGLILLVLGSNLFVDTAVRLAKTLRVPEMAIGATLVSIGTTLPEVMFSATAAFHGHGDMALGNAVGSVICNTALIAGMCQAIRPSPIDYPAFMKGTRRWFAYAIFYCSLALIFKQLPRWSGLLFICLFVFYTMTTFGQGTLAKPENGAYSGKLLRDALLLLLEGAFLYGGAHLLVNNGPALARLIGVPERVISLSLIALGTSLPELMTALSALIKGHGALSIGNILGANTLNLLLVSGVSATILPLYFPQTVLKIDLPVMLAVMCVLCLPTLFQKRIRRWQGFVLLLMYGAYMAYLF